MKGNDFVFDYVNGLSYSCHKLSFSCSGLYIDSPNWIDNKKAIINPRIENDVKCFQYATVVTYNKKIDNAQRIYKIRPFIDKYSWVEINYPLGVTDSNIFVKNNSAI